MAARSVGPGERSAPADRGPSRYGRLQPVNISTDVRRRSAVLAALCLFAVWTLSTWLLEGHNETLLRPEATALRATYAITANILIGAALAILLLRWMVARQALSRANAGFGKRVPSPLWLAVAVSLGFGLYLLQRPPTLDPIVLTNAFAQVLVVSLAEVIVCWALVGAAVESWLKTRIRFAWLPAAFAASVLFGLYHFAHSPPFNSVAMVALLTGVGFLTSAFFFVSRDVYATAIFHNFLGVFGVLRALAASGRLDTLQTLQPALVAMAAAAVAVLGLLHWRLLHKPGTQPDRDALV